DEKTPGTERERTRAARAESRPLRVTADHSDADDRHGTDYGAGRVRWLGHAAREVRDDEARRPHGAGHRVRRKWFPGHGEDRGRLATRSSEAQADARGSGHVPCRWRGAAAWRDLLSEEAGTNAPHAGPWRPGRILSRRDRAGHRRLLPQERRLPLQDRKS